MFVESSTYTAFLGWKRVASGKFEPMLRQIKQIKDFGDDTLLIFENETGRQVDFDLRGTADEVLARLKLAPVRNGPGRPRLGVVPREISLLPRHWEWLETQPQGASAAIRRLIDAARKQDSGEAETRAKIDAVGRVMNALGGNLRGFEEAYRALYARDRKKLEYWIQGWPQDLREYILER